VQVVDGRRLVDGQHPQRIVPGDLLRHLARLAPATRAAVREAIAQRDEQAIIDLAVSQAQAGADYIDVNGADGGDEVANLRWLIELVQANTDKDICIDSANPEAISAGLELARGKPIINSITLEAPRLEAMLPLVSQRDCYVIALCMADDGTPSGADQRVDRGQALCKLLTEAGKSLSDIIIDPCFFPVSSNQSEALALCQAIARLRAELPEALVGGGVSNTSFGLPQRKWINLAMLTIATGYGMNAAIVDPCHAGVMAAIRAAEACTGADEWCMNYITAHREGKLT
jgi:5-methyltetrahydrofolate--homocysteine methyltransferase